MSKIKTETENETETETKTNAFQKYTQHTENALHSYGTINQNQNNGLQNSKKQAILSLIEETLQNPIYTETSQ